MRLKKIISLILAVFMILTVVGCSTNPKTHSKKFKDIKGSWTLDSIYIESKSKKINKKTKTDIEISDSNIKEKYTNKKGKTTENTYPISGISEGSFNLDKNGTSFEYEFNYDPGAKIIHFYYVKSGKQYHEVYTEYKDKIVTSDDKSLENQNKNNSK